MQRALAGTSWPSMRQSLTPGHYGCPGCGCRALINNGWIAATAIGHGVPIVTQDSGYDAMPGVEIIKT